MLRKLFHIPHSRMPAIVNAGWPVLFVAIAAVALALYQLFAPALSTMRGAISQTLRLSSASRLHVQCRQLMSSFETWQEAVGGLNTGYLTRDLESVAGSRVFREILRGETHTDSAGGDGWCYRRYWAADQYIGW